MMVITEKIFLYVKKLPPSSQSEVLDFIEYLLEKAEREKGREEEVEWFNFSLANAMKGMEEEGTSIYRISDLKETYS
jgi:hypothetical protein